MKKVSAKKVFAKIRSVFGKPWIALAMLALAVLFGFADRILGVDLRRSGLTWDLDSEPGVLVACGVSGDGFIVRESFGPDGNCLSGFYPEEDTLRFYLSNNANSEKSIEELIYQVAVGENGEFYVAMVMTGGDADTVYNIYRYSPEGERLERMCGFGREDDDISGIQGLHYREGSLEFVIFKGEELEFYRIDVRTNELTGLGSVTAPGQGIGFEQISALDDSYMVVTTDGAFYLLTPGDELGDPVYQGDFDVRAPEYGSLPASGVKIGETIYILDRCRYMLYTLEDGMLVEFGDPFQEYSGSLATEIVLSLGEYKGELLLLTSERAFTYDGDRVEELELEKKLPVRERIATILRVVGRWLLIGAGLLFLVFLLLIRKTILIKQLIAVVPVLIVMMIIIYNVVVRIISGIMCNDWEDGLKAVTTMSARQIDGDLIKDIYRVSDVDFESYTELQDELCSMIDYADPEWSQGYTMSVCKTHEDVFYAMYGTDYIDYIPFSEEEDYLTAEDLKAAYDEETGLYILDRPKVDRALNAEFFSLNSYLFSGDFRAVAELPDSTGKTVAYLIVKSDYSSLQTSLYEMNKELLWALFLCMLLLIAVVVLITVYTTHGLKKTMKTVRAIADGDLTARASLRSKDELGEICAQVNTMAESLQTIFDEKDKNEQFYYKFVPEQFREVLGKENITDLRLGDATSRELTVLFCDIRSFSLNSEMMTAKENFEFVNIVYGIAGPIIRKHKGFVDKYIGDAVMALFESPDRAVQAGIELYHDIVLDPETARRLKVKSINIGIGIHTGMAEIGIVGEEERLSGTVISNTVNLASRLESLTKTYHTAMLITKDTVDRMEDPEAIGKRYLGMIQVAGVNEVKSVYEVLDCLDEKSKEVRTGNSGEFREAVRLFHMGKREEALKLLERLKQDEVVEMYIDYIRTLSPEEASNVFRFVRK